MRRDRLVLIAITAGALGLRVWSVTWGWPHGLYGDESNYAPNAMRMAADRTLNTGRFHNSHLFTYLCLAEVGVLYLAGYVAGIFHGAREFGAFAWSHAIVILSLARFTTVAFGVATVVGVYIAGRLLHGRAVGWLAAMLLAVSPLHVYYSKVAVNDVPMTAFVLLTLVVTLYHLRTGSARWLYLAAFAAGLAAGAKYNGGLAIVMPLGAVGVTAWRSFQTGASGLRTAAMTAVLIGLVALAGFVLTDPFAVLSFREFLAGFEFQAGLARARWPTQPPDPVPLLMIRSVAAGLGVPSCLAAVAGLFLLLRRRSAAGLTVCAFPIVYVGVMALSQLFFTRFLLPIYPPLALLAGYAVVETVHSVRRWSPSAGRLAAGLIPAVTIAIPLQSALTLNAVLWRQDTRLHAREWLTAHVSSNDHILADSDAAAALDTPSDWPMTVRLTSQNREVLAREWTCARIDRERVTFVLLSSAFTHAVRDPRAAELQDCVGRRAASVVTISPLRPGVTVPEFELSEVTDVLRVLGARASNGPLIRIFEITPR
ncbi:MAG: glycosyltransferase family 39 protein [Acidobacteria bacterium]|nr:glycosyltransferase family 39 protein [Acidobacteriota bacterium]